MNSVWTEVSLLAYQVHIYIQSKAEIQTYFSSGMIEYARAFSLAKPALEGVRFQRSSTKQGC